MTLSRNLIIVLVCCAAVAWLTGPPGRFLVIGTFLLFGPGYLVERHLPGPRPVPGLVRPTLWLGLSLSLIALLYEWTTLAGLALTPPLLGGLTAACGLGVAWCAWRDTSGRAALVPRWWWGAFLSIFVLTLWTRFGHIQNLVLPAWVDSVHHALLVRIAAETGQVPYSLRPYMPVDQLPYHWGYHVFTATVMQLSNLALPQTMLWQGQILNALHALTGAALAAFLWRRPLAGIVAALVIGLVSIMPAYYVSWGRYTQLTGLLLVPPLAIAWYTGLQTGSRRWLAGSAVLLAGLSIVHFRVLVFSAALLAVIALVWAIDQPWALLRTRIWSGLVTGILALALALPWLWVVVSQQLLPAVDQPQSLVGGGDYNTVSAGLLWTKHNRWLIPLALLAALWGLGRRSRAALMQVGWVSVLVIMANPWLITYLLPAGGLLLALWAVLNERWLFAPLGIGLMALNPALVDLPFLWLITNDAVVISFFLPIGVMLGGGTCVLADWLERRQALAQQVSMPAASPAAPGLYAGSMRLHWPFGRLPLRFILFLLLGLITIWGAWSTRNVVNPVTVFVTPGDRQAIDWIAENTPEDARFLINTVGWLPDADRGDDGGYWLLPLTGRWTSTPPALFTYGAPEYVREVQERSRTVRDFAPGQAELIYQLIEREQISHIYLGPDSGPLTADLFAGRAGFEQIYAQDGVIIFAVQ